MSMSGITSGWAAKKRKRHFREMFPGGGEALQRREVSAPASMELTTPVFEDTGLAAQLDNEPQLYIVTACVHVDGHACAVVQDRQGLSMQLEGRGRVERAAVLRLGGTVRLLVAPAQDPVKVKSARLLLVGPIENRSSAGRLA